MHEFDYTNFQVFWGGGGGGGGRGVIEAGRGQFQGPPYMKPFEAGGWGEGGSGNSRATLLHKKPSSL